MRAWPVAAPSTRPLTRQIVAWSLGASFLVQLGVGLVPARATDGGTSVVSLHDDDGGVALFDAGGLRPGRIDRACVALSATGSTDADNEVGLSAEVTNGDLAPYLVVTVERGSVGSFADCGSFTGELLWRGTLAEFPATAATGIPTGWHPAVHSRSVYRFTVTVLDDSRAQRRAAAAAFVWTLRETDPHPEPEPVPAFEPPAADPGTAATDPGPSDVPPSSPPPRETSPAGGSDDGTGGVVAAPPLRAGPSTLEQVRETALSLIRDAHFPAALVTVLVAFLALQGFLDGRDPKLALARTHQDLREFRQFPEVRKSEPR